MTKTLFIILAAGKGTRMRSELPKVFHKVAKRPMVDYSIALAKKMGATKEAIITVLHPSAHSLADLSFVQSQSRVAEQKEQKGTAHAVHSALHMLDKEERYDDVCVLYGDTPLLTSSTLLQLFEKKKETGASIVLMGMRPSDPAQYGRLKIDEAGFVADIIEYKDAHEEEKAIKLCNGGVTLFDFSVLMRFLSEVNNDNRAGEYYLTELISIAARAGKKTAYIEVDERELWGVNRRSELAQVEGEMQKRLRAKHMEAGVTFEDPNSVYFAYDTLIGSDVVIEPNVYFGKGVEIADHVWIKANSYLEGCKIGANVKIGPFARIRPGTELSSQVAIGNFVELKNAKLEEGVKASHLSYIGDAIIGANTNIGAGAITCNYDGEKKHQTKIGKKAFIGSNSALIAPLMVGDEAMIGAGSVITKDVPKGELAIARERQKNLKLRKKKENKG